LKKIIKNISFIFLISFIIHEFIIITDGFIDDDITAINTIIVLGSKVNTDGSLSNRLKARLDTALNVYFNNNITTIIVSGGFGKEGYFEGTVMATYLVEKGVKKEQIIIDNKGNNTRLSALNLKNKLPKINAIIVISQYFHISRSKLAFKQLGIEKVVGIGSKKIELRDIYASFREFFGFYKYLFFY